MTSILGKAMLRAITGFAAGLMSAMASSAAPPPAGLQFLKPIPPVIACGSLAKADISRAVGALVRISSAQVQVADGASYCDVKGVAAPQVAFEVQMPVRGWTQRYLQVGCGGLCGVLSVRIEHDATCAPSHDHELAVASTDMGHQGRAMGDGRFGAEPQARIDFAYRGVHLTALAAKALIQVFYGQAPRYSYFSGCSDGGREALMEAQRFPQDFDGIAAGAPAMNFQVQNSFYHAWMYASNHDAAGRAILLSAKLPALHQAVLAQCDGLDGLKDGIISDPRRCSPRLEAVLCPQGRNDNSCLTAAELAVARNFYQGPRDAAGRHFTIGGPQPGSELAWQGVYVPFTADGPVISQGAALEAIKYLIFPQVLPDRFSLTDFRFDQAAFDRLSALHPLYDATNPDLAAFHQRGGRLILWHGWSDPHISPINTIAYYQAVRDQLGPQAAAAMMRLFLFPGLYHCVGGDGFADFDILTPLMAWVESGAAPDRIVAGQAAFDGPPTGLPPKMDGPPPALPPRGAVVIKATRPVFAFPMVARYAGPADASSVAAWTAAQPETPEPMRYDWAGSGFYAPQTPVDFTAAADGVRPSLNPDPSRSEPPRAQ